MRTSTVPMSVFRPSAHSLAAEAAEGAGGWLTGGSRRGGQQAPGAPTNRGRNIEEGKAEPQQQQPERKDEGKP